MIGKITYDYNSIDKFFEDFPEVDIKYIRYRKPFEILVTRENWFQFRILFSNGVSSNVLITVIN